MKTQTLFIFIGVILIGVFMLGNGKFLAPPLSVVQSQIVDLKDGDVFDLTAGYVTKEIDGKNQTMLAYNGSIPGPTIRVPQGAEVTINFTNGTDVPTLLHSHGVRMDNPFDGSQLQQEEMKPNETFSYKIKFPDAGIYWYHPHAKEVYQQGLGMYGAFLVTPKDLLYYPKVNREQIVFLSDLPIENGKIMLSKDTATHSLMGHYGNVMLTNGEENYTLAAQVGEVVRLYLVNAANVRPFNVSVRGAEMKLVGGDNGAYEKAQSIKSIVLGPSERAIVDVFLPRAGVYALEHTTPERTYSLGAIIAGEEGTTLSHKNEFTVFQENSLIIAEIETFRPFFAQKPDKRLALTIDMNMGHAMMGGGVKGDGIEWEDDMGMMNAMVNPKMVRWNLVDQDTNKVNMDIDWTFKKGTPVKIRIFNDPNSQHPMQHPIHFHGQRFLVVARNGMQQTNLVWKDTTLVRAGETVDIILDPSNPGEWMAHCHISEHLESGMMFIFKVQ